MECRLGTIYLTNSFNQFFPRRFVAGVEQHFALPEVDLDLKNGRIQFSGKLFGLFEFGFASIVQFRAEQEINIFKSFVQLATQFSGRGGFARGFQDFFAEVGGEGIKFLKERVKNKLSFWVSNEVVPFWAFRIKSNELLDLVFEVLFDGSFGFIGFQVDFGDHLQPCFCGCRIG